MLLRLAYLAATNTFAPLRLLPMSDRDKDIKRAVGGALHRLGSQSVFTMRKPRPGRT
ncbi:hypothetical protein ABZ746_36340 [Streptomyces sp. NPDC020096]